MGRPVLTTTTEIVCPHCWETIEVVVDLSIDRQTYIEDCAVCCRPIQLLCLAEAGELLEIRAEATE